MGLINLGHAPFVIEPGMGIDEYLTAMSANKDKLIEQFKALLKIGMARG